MNRLRKKELSWDETVRILTLKEEILSTKAIALHMGLGECTN